MRFEDISRRSELARAEGQDIVVVLGLGFVGTAVAANLARTRTGARRTFFVIGLEQDAPAGRAKAERLDQGRAPTYANDSSLEEVIAAAVVEPRNVAGSVDPRVLGLADVVVSCINLDLERESGQTERLHCPTDRYAEAMLMVGSHMRPGTLVCVESTLPLGTSDKVIYPALCEGQRRIGVDVAAHPPSLAYCYERVMPGPQYLDSVNRYWRAYAGIDAASADRARAFLSKYVEVDQYPLWRHKTIRAAEMAKLLENSYRATNIAFIEEWARLAEQVGVDLFDVIRSIRLRKGTHDNMMLPGLGVGGYCLTKDALLAAWGAESLLGVEAPLPFSRRAILTNESMPLRALDLLRGHFRGGLKKKCALLLGVTYRPGVADTRSSPAETLARALQAEGVEVRAYDPLVGKWDELPELAMSRDPAEAIRGADAVVLCLPDAHYVDFLPQLLLASLPSGAVVIDPWNMLADRVAAELAQRGVALHVFGRGDVPTPVAAKPAHPPRAGAGKKRAP
jgi:nucleotide sugar dehydrogenase